MVRRILCLFLFFYGYLWPADNSMPFLTIAIKEVSSLSTNLYSNDCFIVTKEYLQNQNGNGTKFGSRDHTHTNNSNMNESRSCNQKIKNETQTKNSNDRSIK